MRAASTTAIASKLFNTITAVYILIFPLLGTITFTCSSSKAAVSALRRPMPMKYTDSTALRRYAKMPITAK